MSNGSAAFAAANARTSGVGHEEEFRVLIDEPADQPRAGDAVDLRPLAGDPSGGRPPRHGGAAASGPAGEAIDEITGVESARGQIRGGGLAPVVTVRAVDDDRAPGLECERPFRDRFEGAAKRAGNEAGIGGERRGVANVDDLRGKNLLTPPGERRGVEGDSGHGFSPAALRQR